jgi:hypothetical protein
MRRWHSWAVDHRNRPPISGRPWQLQTSPRRLDSGTLLRAGFTRRRSRLKVTAVASPDCGKPRSTTSHCVFADSPYQISTKFIVPGKAFSLKKVKEVTRGEYQAK